MIRWLREWQVIQKSPAHRWRVEYCATARQMNRVDCGIFLAADTMCTIPDADQHLAQHWVGE